MDELGSRKEGIETGLDTLEGEVSMRKGLMKQKSDRFLP